jgi:choline dehydrogenase-like flavoprotein
VKVCVCRLTEVRQWSVLLLEAGGEEPKATYVPAFAEALHGTDIDWNYATQPGNVSCGGNPCTCPRGKVLGGSSAINGLIYVRGNALDYDNWAELGKWLHSVLAEDKRQNRTRTNQLNNQMTRGIRGWLHKRAVLTPVQQEWSKGAETFCVIAIIKLIDLFVFTWLQPRLLCYGKEALWHSHTQLDA